MADEMRKAYQKPVDEKRLTLATLAKEIGSKRIRLAIGQDHYGYIHREGSRTIYYATLNETIAYHFGGEGRKGKTSGK